MLEPVLAYGLGDLTANDFASAVYNIFFAALVFGAGWLLVQHMQMTHKLRDVEDEVERLNTRVANLKEDLAPSDAPEPRASTPREGPR